MDMLKELLSSDAAHDLGWVLLHSLWLMLIPAGMLALLMRVVPQRMSNARYVMSGVAMLMMAGSLAVAVLLVPERSVAAEPAPLAHQAETIDPEAGDWVATPNLTRIITDEAGRPWQAAPGLFGAEGDPAAGTIVLDEQASPLAETSALPMSSVPDQEAASGPSGDDGSGEPQGWYARSVAAAEPYVAWAVPFWLVGVVGLALWHLGGLIATHRLRSIGSRPAPYAARLRMQRIMRQMGIVRPVTLLESSVVRAPAVIGFLKPVVLIPASVFTGLTPAQLEAILAHELAHIRRHDYLVNLVQTLLVTLLFYHPAVWWVSRVIRNERECCCDDMVVRLTDRKLDYAKALTQVAMMRSSADGARLAVAADHGSLLERIKRLMGIDETAAPSGVSPQAWLAGALVLVVAIALPITFAAGNDGLQAEDADAAEEVVEVEEDAELPAFQSIRVRIDDKGHYADTAPQTITVQADGSYLYEIEEVPAQGDRSRLPAARIPGKLSEERLAQLQALITATDNLSAEAALQGPPLTSHQELYTLTLTADDGSTRTTETQWRKTTEPYTELMEVFLTIRWQEHLYYKLAWVGAGAAGDARQRLNQYAMHELGVPHKRAAPYPIDFGRFVDHPFAEEVNDPFDVGADHLAAAIHILAAANAQQHREAIEALHDDRNRAVRQAVARALLALNHPDSIPVLAQMVGRTHDAGWALIQFGAAAEPVIESVIRAGAAKPDSSPPEDREMLRAYLDHAEEIDHAIHPQIIEAVRAVIAQHEGTARDLRYHHEFLELAERLKVLDRQQHEADTEQGTSPWLGEWRLVQEGSRQVPEGAYRIAFTEQGTMIGKEDGRIDFENEYRIEIAEDEEETRRKFNIPIERREERIGTLYTTDQNGVEQQAVIRLFQNEIRIMHSDEWLVLRRADGAKPEDAIDRVERRVPGGPVVLVSASVDPDRAFYDLDEHRYVTPPVDLDLSDSAAVWAWMRESGADLVGGYDPEQTRGLLAPNAVHARMSDQDWQSPDADAINKTLAGSQFNMIRFHQDLEGSAAALDVEVVSTDSNASRTWAIASWDTRQQRRGWVIQFLRYIDDPGGLVVFRYQRLNLSGEHLDDAAAPNERLDALRARLAALEAAIAAIQAQDNRTAEDNLRWRDYQIEAEEIQKAIEALEAPVDPAEAILGVWYGQFVDSSYLPTDRWCVWEFREGGKNVYTLGGYDESGVIPEQIDPQRARSMVTDYEIDDQGRLVLYIPGEDTKVCPFEIRDGTIYISVDEANDFVFTREEKPDQFEERREANRIERASRQIESNARMLTARWMGYVNDHQGSGPVTLIDIVGDQPWLALSPLAPMPGVPRGFERWDAEDLSAWLGRHAGFAYLPIGDEPVAAWASTGGGLPAGHVLFFERPTPKRTSLWVTRIDERGHIQSKPELMSTAKLDELLKKQTGDGLDRWAFNEHFEQQQDAGPAARRVVIPDVDEAPGVGKVLDLRSGELLELPANTNERDAVRHFEALGKGDLIFDSAGRRAALITLRDAELSYGQEGDRAAIEQLAGEMTVYPLQAEDACDLPPETQSRTYGKIPGLWTHSGKVD